MRTAQSAWLFSPAVDLGVFLGSAVVSLALLGIGATTGVLNDRTPDWMWIPAVLLIDVAHVWATGFRVYFDKTELLRRPWLYGLTPLIAFAVGVFLYAQGELVFWRVLAYVAVFHFIRQQYGWVALYRARAGEQDRFGFWIDASAIYVATLFPLVYWHAHLPRQFSWFLENDFVGLPGFSQIERVLQPIYWLVLAAYVFRSLYRRFVKGEANTGKDIVIVTTAVCWYTGIVALNSDYAFTVTNVIIHGVPYFALVYWYARSQGHRRNPFSFLATLWAIAFMEEMLWDRGVWHDRAWFFGSGWSLDYLRIVIVPLLAVPQLTHYVLDGFIWKRRSNPSFVLVGNGIQEDSTRADYLSVNALK